jgi:uncharacterized protein Yka (UPF0111/DUF47 family)
LKANWKQRFSSEVYFIYLRLALREDEKMKSLKGILVVGEKTVFSELTQIIDKAAETNTLVRRMFTMDYKEDEIRGLAKAVLSVEKASDEIAFKTSASITSGAVSPNVIDDLLDSVQMADDIVDLHYYLSEELERMAKAYTAGFGSHHVNWEPVYEDMLVLAEKSLSKLKEALTTSNVPEILELRKQIEDLEEQGDHIKGTGFNRLYAVAPNMHYLEFYHSSELLHKCDDILDSCEDLADLIVSVVTSILK